MADEEGTLSEESAAGGEAESRPASAATAPERVSEPAAELVTESAAPAAGPPASVAAIAGPGVSRGPLWRRILAWAFLVLACIMIPLAVTGDWFRATVVSTDGFVETLSPLATEPPIQRAVSDTVTSQLFTLLTLEQRVQELFPDRLGFLAVPLVAQLQEWVEEQVNKLVAGQRFAGIWEAGLHQLHDTLVNFFRGTGPVVLGPDGVVQLELTPLTAQVIELLGRVGVELPSDQFPVLTTGTLPIVQVDALERVRGLLRTLNYLFIVLPILAVAFLAGSVAVAVKRSRAVMRAGIGVMIAIAVFLVVLAVSRQYFVEATAQVALPLDAADVIWDHLTLALRVTAWTLFFVGFLMLLYPFVVRLLKGRTLETAADLSVEKGLSGGRVAGWFSRHRLVPSVALLIVGFLVLAIWDTPSILTIAVVAGLVIVGEIIIAFLARQGESAARARLP